MVLPPSKLKDSIYDKSPKGTYDFLLSKGWLKSKSSETRAKIIELVTLYQQPSEPTQGPIICGPSSLDNLASQLCEFLNERGLEAYYSQSSATDETPRWWEFWKR